MRGYSDLRLKKNVGQGRKVGGQWLPGPPTSSALACKDRSINLVLGDYWLIVPVYCCQTCIKQSYTVVSFLAVRLELVNEYEETLHSTHIPVLRMMTLMRKL